MRALEKEAQIRYFHGQFDIRASGDYVKCAVTGQHIPLAQLRYWSVPRQEAYLSPKEALESLDAAS